MAKTKKMYRVSTYAKLKGVARGTVYHWVNTGQIGFEKIDRTYFVVVWEDAEKA